MKYEYRVLILPEYSRDHEDAITEYANAGFRLIQILDWGPSGIAYFEREKAE